VRDDGRWWTLAVLIGGLLVAASCCQEPGGPGLFVVSLIYPRRGKM
jgi:hypothetical protein